MVTWLFKKIAVCYEKQTVNDISTPCLWACVDNKQCLTVSVNSALSTRRVAALGQRTRTPCLNTSPSTVCRAVTTPAGTTLSDRDNSPSTVCRAVSTPAGTTLSDQDNSPSTVCRAVSTPAGTTLSDQDTSPSTVCRAVSTPAGTTLSDQDNSPSTVCRAVCTPAGTTLSDQDTSPSTVCRAVSTPAGTTLSDRAKSSNIIAFIFITSSKVSLAPQRSSSRPLYSSSVSCDTGDSSRATECSDGLVLVDQFADDLLYSSGGFQVSAVFGISKYRDIGSVSVFLPRDAMLARYMPSSCVYLSVTSWCTTKMAKPRITHTTPGTSVFWRQNFRRNSKRVTPPGAPNRQIYTKITQKKLHYTRIKREITLLRYCSKSQHTNATISQKRCKVGTELLWNDNRKSYVL